MVKLAEHNLRNYAIGTLSILLLVSLGFNVAPDDTHFCRDLEIAKSCNRLSGTENTCYPVANTRIGSKFCSSGWELILKEPDQIIDNLGPATTGKAYSCEFNKPCAKIR